jgi:N-acetylneuraminic acid mutarotase
MKKMKSGVIRKIFSTVLFIGMLYGCIDDSRDDIDGVVVNGAVPELSDLMFVSHTASTVVLQSAVEKANGYKVTERGFCWGIMSFPTKSDNHIVVGDGGKGEFVGTIDGLQGDTKYYFRAYATNEKGTSYTTEDTLTTNNGLGKVRTLEVMSRRATTAVSGGKIELYGEGAFVSYGIFKALSANMANKDTIRCTNPIVADSFLCNISGLNADTHYYVQAFVQNHFGTFTGNVVEFSTGSGKPVIDSVSIYEGSIGYGEVTVVSAVLEAGDGTLRESGFCWSQTPMPTIESGEKKKCRDDEIGPFVAQIDGLTPQQTYYLRAYARNDFGTVYSNELVIQTKSQLPLLKTNLPLVNSAIGTVILGGQIMDQGKSPIVAKGVCYSSTISTPTISNSTTVNLAIADPFSIELSDLKGESTYYVRAYARNNEGVSYGETMTFTTPQIFNGGLSVFPQTPPLEASSSYFVIGDRFYLLGGDIGPQYTNELWSYSRTEDRWRQLRDYPNSAYKWQSAVGFGATSVYVLGGINIADQASDDFHQYVPANNTWFSLPKGPDSAYLRTGITLGNEVCYFGGMKDVAKDDVWAFHVISSTWTQRPAFPAAQYGGIALRIDSAVYVGLGKNTSGECNKTLWESTDELTTWTQKTTFPTINSGVLVGVTFKGNIYIIDESYIIYEYNPQTSVWKTRSHLPSSMRDIQCMYALGDAIYIGFGNNSLVMYNPLWDN